MVIIILIRMADIDAHTITMEITRTTEEVIAEDTTEVTREDTVVTTGDTIIEDTTEADIIAGITTETMHIHIMHKTKMKNPKIIDAPVVKICTKFPHFAPTQVPWLLTRIS
mgnify:CR=1 FL=1